MLLKNRLIWIGLLILLFNMLSASATVTWYNQTDGFKLSNFGTFTGAYGLASNISGVWIAESDMEYIYHSSWTGVNQSDGISLVPSGSSNPFGITLVGNGFWVVDETDAFLYHINSAGVNQSDGFKLTTNFADTTAPSGVTSNGSGFWWIDRTNDFLFHASMTGTNLTGGCSLEAIGSTTPYGVAMDTSGFWIVDYDDSHCYHLSFACENLSDGFDTAQFGSGLPRSITINGTDMFILDSQDDFVYHLSSVLNPEVTLQSPRNNYNSSTSSVSLIYNVSIQAGSVSNCSLYIDNLVTDSDSTITLGANQSFNATYSDGTYNWKVQCESDLGVKKNSTERTFTVDTTYPTLSQLLLSHNIYNYSASMTTRFSYNATDTKWLDSCWYNTSNNATITQYQCNTTQVLNFTTQANHTLWYYANDSAGNQVYDTTSVYSRYIQETLRETADSMFESMVNVITLEVNATEIPDVTAFLVWNNTNYGEGIKTKVSNNSYTFVNSFTIPFGAGNLSGITQNYNYSYNISSIVNDSLAGTQVVYNTAILNCTETTANVTINFTIRDEQTGDVLNGTLTNTSISQTYVIRPSYGSLVSQNFSFTETINWTSYAHKELCITPSWANVSADYDVIYSAIGYSQRNYYVKENWLNNLTKNINLYLLALGSQSNVTIVVIDQNSDAMESIIVKAYRYDTGTGLYTLVESDITDYEGKTYMYLYAADTKYKFEFYDGETLLDTKTDITIPATNLLTFQLLVGAEKSLDIENEILSEVTHTLTWNNDTRYVSFYYSGTADIINSGCLRLMNNNMSTNQTTVTNCSTATTNTIVLYITPSSTDTYTATTYIISAKDNNNYYLDTLIIDLRTAAAKFPFGEFGIALSILIIISLALVGVATGSSTVTLIFTSIGLVAAAAFQLLPVTYTALIGIVTLFVIFALMRVET